MAAWDSADLLKVFKEKVRLPDASEYDDAADLCPRASRAQVKVVQKIAAIYPNAMYATPFALTAATDRKTFTFGTDSAGNAIVPLGWVQIATSLAAFSGDSFVGWVEGEQFIDEGYRIRISANRTYGGTLYSRAVLTPPEITSLVAPVINPASARDLIAIQMAKDWAADGNGAADLGARMDRQWAEEFPTTMLALRRRYRNGGGMYDPARWYLFTGDLGTTT